MAGPPSGRVERAVAEDQRLRVKGPRVEHAASEDRMTQEQCEACPGCDTKEAVDRHARAAGSVEGLQVDVDRLTVAATTDWNLRVHLVEVERLRLFGAGGT